MLSRIFTAVFLILWGVMTQILFWPIAWGIAEIRDMGLLSSNVLPLAAVVAAVLSYVGCRLLFPIEYPKDV